MGTALAMLKAAIVSPDVVFRDDECRVRIEHAPANFTTIKHMALKSPQTASKQTILAWTTQSRILGR